MSVPSASEPPITLLLSPRQIVPMTCGTRSAIMPEPSGPKHHPIGVSVARAGACGAGHGGFPGWSSDAVHAMMYFPDQRGRMGVEETVSAHSQVPLTPTLAAPPPADLVDLAERAFRTALGLASLVAGSVTAAVTEAIRGEVRDPDDEPQPDDGESWPKPLAPILAGAALGVAIESARVGTRAASAVGRNLRPWISFAKSPTFVRERLGRIRDRASELDDRWRKEQQEDESIGSSFVGAVVPQIVNATLDQLDLTELVLSRVDLERVVDAVDLERAVSRVDVDAIVSGIDLDAIVARVDIEAIVRRVDLAAIAREVIDQLDLASIAKDVIDEIDLPQIMRESTGTMANETVEGVRVQSMIADRTVSRFVDRLLGREGERDEPEGDA
jgi:hypothetical protein